MSTNKNSDTDKNITINSYWAHMLNMNLKFNEKGFDLSRIFDFTLMHEDLFVYQTPWIYYKSKMNEDYQWNNEAVDNETFQKIWKIKHLWVSFYQEHKENDKMELVRFFKDLEVFVCTNFWLNKLKQSISMENVMQNKKLWYLLIYGGELKSAEFLDNFPKLTHLGLRSNRELQNIKPIENINALTYLDLHAANLTSSKLEIIKGLTNLVSLDISRNFICNLHAIKDLSKLEYLDCSNNRIISLSPLENLENLKWLIVRNNQIPEKELYKFRLMHLNCNIVATGWSMIDEVKNER